MRERRVGQLVVVREGDVRKSQQAASRTRGSAERATASARALTADEAFIALFIAAMHANDHMSAAEGARAHHLIWSMKRFRRKSGETVGRGIERMRQFVSEHGSVTVIAAAARAIPARLRLPAFALTADLLLADGTIEPTERRFLDELAADLRLDIGAARQIVGAMLVKNQA